METSNIKVNEAEKVDNTKITAQMLSEQERLSQKRNNRTDRSRIERIGKRNKAIRERLI